MIILEKRPYNSDSTQEEIEMLKSRVNLINDDTICYQEVYVLSEFQIGIMSKRASELVVAGKDNYMILNLSHAKPPNAAQRKKIRECFSKFTEHIIHTSIYTQNNVLNNIAAKFILGSIGFPINSIHTTRDQSLESIKKARAKRLKNDKNRE